MVDKPSEERNLTDRSRGASKSFLHTLTRTRREGMAWGNCVELKGILPCVGCVGIVDAKRDLVQVSIALWLRSLA